MAKELNVSYAEELSPDEYLGEDPQEEAGREETEKKKAEKKEEGEYVSKLISPWEVARAFREDKVLARWKEELDLIGDHWKPRISEDEKVEDLNWDDQILRAWMWTYTGLRINCTKHFAYRKDLDALIDKTMDLLTEDIKSYDPSKSSLGSRISNKMKLRLKDAMRLIGAPRDHDTWRIVLRDLENTCPKNREDKRRWAEKTARKIFQFYRKRVDSKLRKEKRAEAREGLIRNLMERVPDEIFLEDLVKEWVMDVLGGDRTDPSLVSLDLPVGEEGEDTLGDMLAAPEADDREEVLKERRKLASQAMELAALQLNYQSLLNPNAAVKDQPHRFNRMCYSERLVYLASQDALPVFNEKDMYRALLEHYVRFFARMPGEEELLRLEKLTLRTEEEILDPKSSEETWRTPLKWTGKNMFLQSFVPQTYVQRVFDQTLSGSAVSNMRTDFHNMLNRQLSQRYSEEELAEIWLADKKEKGKRKK